MLADYRGGAARFRQGSQQVRSPANPVFSDGLTWAVHREMAYLIKEVLGGTFQLAVLVSMSTTITAIWSLTVVQ